MKKLSTNLILLLAVIFPIGGMAQTRDSGLDDEVPEAPRISPGSSAGFQKRAGIGGEIAFAEAGVVELGGAIGLTSSDDVLEFSATPTVGYFIANNVQVSALGTWNYTKVDDDENNSSHTSNVGTLLIEPSLHYTLTNTQFVFFGLGAGGMFAKGEKPGAALAPRIGYKQLLGRSGMVTFAVQSVFGMNESEVQTTKGTVLTVENAMHASLGYSVLL